jgi:hypothetical protein
MRSAQWPYGITLAALLAVPFLGIGQENKGKPTRAPVDAPGAVHKQLDVLTGKWDVEVTYILNGKENRGKAQCESRWVLDGRFLQQEYRSQLLGKPFVVLQHLGYDNQKNKTIEIKMDSLSTGVLHNEGSISKDGKVISNEGESLDPRTHQKFKLRTLTTIIDPDHYTLEWLRPGADGKDEKLVSMKHTRRKP